MRTDVKVGLVVGLIVLAGGVIYVASQKNTAGSGVTDVVPLRKPVGPADTGAKGPQPIKEPAKEPRHTPGAPAAPLKPLPAASEPAPKPPGETGAGVPPGVEKPEEPALQPTVPPSGLPPVVRTGPGERPVETPPPIVRGPAADTQPATSGPGPTPGEPGRPPSVLPRPSTEPNAPAPKPGPAPAERPPPAAVGVKKHVVAEGETLSLIAEDYYGDRELWTRIKAANPDLVNPDLIVPGQTLIIPPKEGPVVPARETPKPQKPAPATGSERGAGEAPEGSNKRAGQKAGEAETKPKARLHTYVVERGDTLVSIARNVLKDGSRWREIYELNKSKIKDPDRLLVGTELRLPEK